MAKLTPTEQRIYDLLRDGVPHGRSQLYRCLGDTDDPDLARTLLSTHISRLNDKIMPHGRKVTVFGNNGGAEYALVRLFADPAE